MSILYFVGVLAPFAVVLAFSAGLLLGFEGAKEFNATDAPDASDATHIRMGETETPPLGPDAVAREWPALNDHTDEHKE